MGTGYTRNDTLNNIADGNIINASDLDGEFDAVESAFNESTGHTHDGTAAEGAPITVLGPVQDFIASATEIKPKTTNTLDIGTVSLQFKDMYLDGTAYIDGLGEDILVATDKKVQFRDTALFINSSVDGQLDIDADVELELVAPTVDIDASTAVTIDTATLTITGSANVVGDLDVDNININGNTIISTDTNGDINISPDGTGTVVIDTDLDVDNININGNTISSTDTNGNLTIDPNGTGDIVLDANVGIGTSSPSSTLDVEGSSDAKITIRTGNNTGYSELHFGDSDADNRGQLYYSHSTDSLSFATSGSFAAAIDSSGNVGIGTTSPSGLLHLSANTATTTLPSIVFQDTGTTSTRLGSLTNNNGDFVLAMTSSLTDLRSAITLFDDRKITFDISGSEEMRIDSSGNVGIGTTSPDGRLHVLNGSAGSVTANANADELVIENSGTAGLSILTPDASTGYIIFGSASDNEGAIVRYNQSGALMTIGTEIAGGQLAFRTASGTEAMRIDSSGRVGIGTTSPSRQVHISGSGANTRLRVENTTGSNVLDVYAEDGGNSTLNYSSVITMSQSGTERLRIDSTGRVGIGTTSPSRKVAIVDNGAQTDLSIVSSTSGVSVLHFGDTDADNQGQIIYRNANDQMEFTVNGLERMRIDTNGNLLVGTTDNNVSDNSGASNGGINIGTAGVKGVISAAAGQTVAYLNRLGSDGDIVNLRKDGTTVGSIGSYGGVYANIGTSDVGLMFNSAGQSIVPHNMSTNATRDDAIDLGQLGIRFDDVYATNGTIQTSDANEKQQIAALTDAEMTAAKAISALFKTYKWNSAVTEKGDAARTHTGVIAQDVQAAMTAAGLDAGDYAFFISGTWWETQTEVPAVEAVEAVLDEDGNVVTEAVEAQEAYTRTDTYDTAEEAPEGATERTRMGIRYPELLAFVGAATEQRLANIETRLAALEAN